MTQLMLKSELTNQKKWTDIFPAELTKLNSFVFVKRLTEIAFPTILYMRKVLPASEFESKALEGMTLKFLKKGTQNVGAQKVQTWLSGAIDALKKRYLKSMTLEVKDAKSDLTLELYTLIVKYDSGNPSLSTQPGGSRASDYKISEIQAQTVRLLQMCYVVTKSCLDLPPEVSLSMKISYQEGTPLDYQPIGYKAFIPTIPTFANKTRKIEIGCITTNTHSIELRNKSCLINEKLLPKPEKVKETNSSMDTNSDIMILKKNVPASRAKSAMNDQASPLFRAVESRTMSQSTGEGYFRRTDIGSQSGVRCPCLSEVKTSVMYQCSGCSYWVHAECFGKSLDRNNVSKIVRFYCQICHKLNKGDICDDQLMVELPKPCDQQKLAILRKFLGFCNRAKAKELSFRQFEKVSGLTCHESFIRGILEEMIQLHILRKRPGDMYSANMDEVHRRLHLYFNVEPVEMNEVGVAVQPVTPELGKRKFQEKVSKPGKRECTGLRDLGPRRSGRLALNKTS